MGALALTSLPLLAGTSAAADFSNTAPIVVPRGPVPSGCPADCPVDEANPYPSTIAVSGLTGGTTDVNVTLHGFQYGIANESGPADVDLMVVAPSGTAVMLMSDACGDSANLNTMTSPIDLTFDDSAPGSLPEDTACSTGTFKPTNDDNDGAEIPPTRVRDGFLPPAPSPGVTTPLAAFNGTDPNGTWSLYVVDDGPNDPGGNDGQIGGGWTLAVTGGGTLASTTTTTAASATTSTTTGATTTSISTTTSSSTTTTVAGPILRLSSTQVAPGERVTLAGDRLPANLPLTMNFLSAPVTLGTVTTSATGSFQNTVTIPSAATAGAHQINVTNAAGTALASVDLTVVRASTGGGLARTGGSALAMVLMAATAILLGYFFFTSQRMLGRRRPW